MVILKPEALRFILFSSNNSIKCLTSTFVNDSAELVRFWSDKVYIILNILTFCCFSRLFLIILLVFFAVYVVYCAFYNLFVFFRSLSFSLFTFSPCCIFSVVSFSFIYTFLCSHGFRLVSFMPFFHLLLCHCHVHWSTSTPDVDVQHVLELNQCWMFYLCISSMFWP